MKIKYPILIILLSVSLALIVAIIVIFFNMAQNNAELRKLNNQLISKIDALVEASNQIDNTDGLTPNVIYLYDNNSEEPKEFLEAYSIFRSEIDSFMTKWEMILTIFGFIMAIYAIAVPLMNYIFFQKDQLDNFVEKSDASITKFKQEQKIATADVHKIKEECILEVNERIGSFNQEFEEIKALINRDDFKVQDIGHTQEQITIDKFNQEDVDNLDEATEYAEQAEKFYSNRKYGLAQRKWNMAIKLDPDRDDFYRELSRTLINLKKYDEAIKNGKKACELNESERNFSNLAHIYNQAYKLDEAIKAIDKAISVNENNASNYKYKALIYISKGEYKKAIIEAKKAATLERPSAWDLYAISTYYEKDNNLADAINYLEKAVELEPDNEFFRKSLNDMKK